MIMSQGCKHSSKYSLKHIECSKYNFIKILLREAINLTYHPLSIDAREKYRIGNRLCTHIHAVLKIVSRPVTSIIIIYALSKQPQKSTIMHLYLLWSFPPLNGIINIVFCDFCDWREKRKIMYS